MQRRRSIRPQYRNFPDLIWNTARRKREPHIYLISYYIQRWAYASIDMGSDNLSISYCISKKTVFLFRLPPMSMHIGWDWLSWLFRYELRSEWSWKINRHSLLSVPRKRIENKHFQNKLWSGTGMKAIIAPTLDP